MIDEQAAKLDELRMLSWYQGQLTSVSAALEDVRSRVRSSKLLGDDSAFVQSQFADADVAMENIKSTLKSLITRLMLDGE